MHDNLPVWSQMNQSEVRSAAAKAALQSKNLVGQQVDRQAAALGSTLSQTARDLEQIGTQLSQSGTISGAAELAQRAATYVDRAGRYLENGTTDDFIVDLESFSRERPWAIAASAAALGFIAARLVKSSSARRRAASTYGYPGEGLPDDPPANPSDPAFSRYQTGSF